MIPSSIDRHSSINTINNRYSGITNSIQLQDRGSTFIRPLTVTSNRTSQGPVIFNPSQNMSIAKRSQVSIPILESRPVTINLGENLGNSSVRYTNFIPHGAIPADQYRRSLVQDSLRYTANQSYQQIPQSHIQNHQSIQNYQPPFPTYPAQYQPQPVYQQPYPPMQPYTTSVQQRHTTTYSQVPPPIHNVSQVIPVPVIPTGPSQMRNTVLRNSMSRSKSLYMVDDQYIQRPPNLSYIDKETSTCPVWVWGLLGTLALLGIVLTLVVVGKKNSSNYVMTNTNLNQTENTSNQSITNITEQTTQNKTQTNQTNVTPPDKSQNETQTQNKTTQTNETNTTTNATMTPLLPLLPFTSPNDIHKTDEQLHRQLLIKQQNSTILSQQMELQNLRRSLQALKNQKQVTPQPITPITPPVTVVSNPLNISTLQSQNITGTAIDVVECQAGYYPYGGICFPCKNGKWNGTNCIQNKNNQQQSTNVDTSKATPTGVIQVPQTTQSSQSKQTSQQKKQQQSTCQQGFFKNNGKCISCPEGSTWNGTNCIKKRQTQQKQTQKENQLCPQGEFFISGSCTKCPDGLFWDGKGCFQKPLRKKHLKIYN